MTRLYLFSAILLFRFSGFAQTLVWSEDFGTGCDQGQLATGHGNWQVTDLTGANNASNKFYVSATEAGMGVGNCGDGCLATGGTNKTLHVGTVYIEYMGFPLADADPGAAYNAGGIGGFGFQSTTDIMAETPWINVSGYTNLTISFNYMEGGDANDNASLWYNNGGGWTQLVDLPKTVTCGSGQGTWTAYSTALPASSEGLIQIGFRWVNNDDGSGTDPSFAVDDIEVFDDVTTGIPELHFTENLLVTQDVGRIGLVCSSSDEKLTHIQGFDILGQKLISAQGEEATSMSLDVSAHSGIMVLQITTNKGQYLRKLMVR